MTDVSHAAGGVRRRLHRGERLEFRALLAATYPLFLIAVMAERIGGETVPGARLSVFAEAYETAAAALAQAFMG